MRKALQHILLFAGILLASTSCGPQIIDMGDMEDILHDMLVLDQQIKQDQSLRKQADTLLVYEGIFRDYGYHTDDFQASLTYYLENSSKMEKIMANVAGRFEKESKEVGKLIDQETWRNGFMRIYSMTPSTKLPRPPAPPIDTLALRFTADSLLYLGL